MISAVLRFVCPNNTDVETLEVMSLCLFCDLEVVLFIADGRGGLV